MRASSETFFNLKRLHAVFALSAIALMGATVWMIAADHRREWKVYQRTFRDEVEPKVAGTEPDDSLGKRILSLPLIDAWGRPLAIDQIWLPELTLDYHFRSVARTDRCTSCHQGIDKPAAGFASQPQPYASHPRLDLFVGSASPHPKEEFGCTVCHDGQGSATEFKYASHSPNTIEDQTRWRSDHGWFWNHDWALPMRPSRFQESNCLKCHHEVADLDASDHFPVPPAPKLLAGYHLVRTNGCFGCHEIRGVSDTGERIGPDLRLEPSGREPSPGTMRKVGPSLRDVAGKLDAAFLDAWIAAPHDFRPATRMPQFFGMHEHLQGKGLDEARRFEPVELRAMTEYLLSASQPVPPLPAPSEVTQKASAERGKRLFETQGCLACHKHADFPKAQSVQGPDLSRLAAKLTTPAGKAWLTGWLRDPARHSPRTLMPNPLLTPLVPKEAGKVSDPAVDIAEYLLSPAEWKPAALPPLVEADLDELALLHLAKSYPKDVAQRHLREGFVESAVARLPADAEELVGPVTLQKKLRYVGRRTIRKRGCYGCHDIPGFEDAQLIGPALSDWGRKQESLLAFENVHEFAVNAHADKPKSEDEEFYLHAIRSKRREGFAWQKLGDPRSFDYQRTDAKGYNEQLLMGRFALTAAERESAITFLLGLVTEPPKARYLPQPDRRQQAIVEGRKVLDKFGCAQCHTLEMERWTIQVDPEKFLPPPPTSDYDFLKPRFTPEQIAASLEQNPQGLVQAEIVGMPQWNAHGAIEELEDEDGNPQYSFILWKPAAIAGEVWPVGGASVLVAQPQIVAKRPPRGGDFARLLFPLALEQAKEVGSTAAVQEAWGWVPPPLVNQGASVRPDWLHNYLLRPTVIRPAARLRMPQYNLSSEEAAKLVDYFAAVAGVEFPYVSSSQTGLSNAAADKRRQEALRLLIDRTTYCAKCHVIGDFSPGGESWTILAPNLEDVAGRIRPEHLRRWLANPKSVLPYSPMPSNFPPDQTMGQDLLQGSSREQLDAVLDLLLHYDETLRRRSPVRSMMEEVDK